MAGRRGRKDRVQFWFVGSSPGSIKASNAIIGNEIVGFDPGFDTRRRLLNNHSEPSRKLLTLNHPCDISKTNLILDRPPSASSDVTTVCYSDEDGLVERLLPSPNCMVRAGVLSSGVLH